MVVEGYTDQEDELVLEDPFKVVSQSKAAPAFAKVKIGKFALQIPKSLSHPKGKFIKVLEFVVLHCVHF
jgi:hypothetical protein